ncbi:MAG: hypothetical protein QGH24_02120 [Candidatus Marinimicrobia bacterium]|jgi:hypothetical protein|nr:hypothetical protein [Candidatus Neomarinimicrobiota bacterium]
MQRAIKTILPLSILFIIGCEGLYDKNQDKPSESADLEALAKELTEELGMNKDQENGLYSSIRKGDRFNPHPARLWQMAVELSTSLTESQIEQLLTPPNDSGFHDFSYGLKPDDSEKSARKDEFFISIMRTLLTTEQLEEFELILAYRNEQSDLLKNSLESGELEFKEFMLHLKALRMLYKVQLEDLMTEEQEEELQSIMEEKKPRHFHKGKDSEKLEKIKEAKIEALGLIEEQIQQLETLMEEMENSLEELKTSFINEEITQELFRENLVVLFQDHHENRRAVFREGQLLIIDIHRVLAVRAHRHFFKHKWFKFHD